MDRAFFEQLAMPLFDQLYNHACWLTGDRTDAEDLVQETYAKALKGLRSFRGGHQYPSLDVSHSAQHLPDIEERPSCTEERNISKTRTGTRRNLVAAYS